MVYSDPSGLMSEEEWEESRKRAVRHALRNGRDWYIFENQYVRFGFSGWGDGATFGDVLSGLGNGTAIIAFTANYVFNSTGLSGIDPAKVKTLSDFGQYLIQNPEKLSKLVGYSITIVNLKGGNPSGQGGEKSEPWLTVNFNRGIPQIETNFTDKDWGAITPGPFIVYPKGGSNDKYYNTHELGHVIQFLILGQVAYYGLVAIPSLITSTTPYHSDMPWEKSANQLWYWLTGETHPKNKLYFGPNKK